MLDIYLDPCTINCRKVLAGLALLDVKYNYHFIDYFAGGQKDPSFTKINPMATVPAGVDGSLILTESNSILQYAGDLDGKDHAAYPKDIRKRAEINKWLFWESSVWFASCYVYTIENVAKPELMSAQPDEKVVGAEKPKWEKLAAVLDGQLKKHKFVAGEEVTIADIAVAACMHLHPYAKFPIEKYEAMQKWYGEIEKLPCWRETNDAVIKSLVPSVWKKQQNGEHHHLPIRSNGHQDGKSVRSTLNYTKDLSSQGQLTEVYFYEDEAGKWKDVHEPGDDEHEVSFYDGWDRAQEFDYDRHGFAVKDFSSSYSGGWENEESVKREFYPEVVEFLKREMGVKRVLVFDHTIRTKGNQGKKLTQETNTTQRTPVRLVHCDYTAESGPVRVKQLLGDEAEDLLSRRVAFVNVWKPLAKVEEMPLAMCDVTSSPSEDFFKLYLRYRDRTGENYVMRYSSQHKWWYFPDMEADKVILLKTFDSDKGKARFVGHSAFEDPTSKKDAPFRESVEIRTIVFF